jgi:hypothetical protein
LLKKSPLLDNAKPDEITFAGAKWRKERRLPETSLRCTAVRGITAHGEWRSDLQATAFRCSVCRS